MPDPLLVTGAVLAAAVALAHSILGEMYILRPLLSADLPAFPAGRRFSRRTMRFAWHLTSVAWLGLGGVLLAPGDALVAVALTFGASAVITIVASRGKHLAWIVFGAIAGLAWVAR